MALLHVKGCTQSAFKARLTGSCWGISIEFCKKALNTDAIRGMDALLSNAGTVADDAERHMITQQTDVHDIARPKYIKESSGVPDFDSDTLAGRANQGIAIQVRHQVVKDLLKDYGIKNIGTLSSFYEGGTVSMIKRLISLSKKAGQAASLFDLQSPDKGHTVVLHYAAPALHFFDPNDGLWRASNIQTATDITEAANDLGARFHEWKFTFAHLLIKS